MHAFLVAVMAVVTLAGCGGSGGLDDGDATPSRIAPTQTSPAGEPEFSIELPQTRAEGDEWIRRNLSVYEHAYRECFAIIDTSSPTFDPSNMAPERMEAIRTDLIEEAGATGGGEAAWVAQSACQDGLLGVPRERMPELQHLPSL